MPNKATSRSKWTARIPKLVDIFVEREFESVKAAFQEAVDLRAEAVRPNDGDQRTWLRSLFEAANDRDSIARFVEQLLVRIPEARPDVEPLLPASWSVSEHEPWPIVVNEGLRPGLSSVLGSIHLHIDGGEYRDIAEQSARLIDPQLEHSEIVTVSAFVAGPQRDRRRDLYASHTPTDGDEEALSFFSTTVLHDGKHTPTPYERAVIEDLARTVLGSLTAARPHGGVVVEVEQVVGIVRDDRTAEWAPAPSSPPWFGPTFIFAKAAGGHGQPVYETHIAVDVPAADSRKPPLELKELLRICADEGIEVGGWFLFAKPDQWAYRSNMFGLSADKNEAIRMQTVLRQRVRSLAGPGLSASTVRVLVEESLGVWKTDFPKIVANARTVPELAAWEAEIQEGSTFWAVTGNFLGDLHRGTRDAMLRNFARGIRYIYFLRSYADLVRWQRFRDELENEYRESLNDRMFAYVIEFEASRVWSEKLDCFINYPPQGAPQGFRLRRDPLTSRVMHGIPTTASEIEIVEDAISKIVDNASLVGSRRATKDRTVQGAVIWLHFGLEGVAPFDKRPEDVHALLEEFDRATASPISQCDGEVLMGNETGYAVLIPLRSDEARVGPKQRRQLLSQAYSLALDLQAECHKALARFGAADAPQKVLIGYGELQRVVRTYGCITNGDILRRCRIAVAMLPAGAIGVFDDDFADLQTVRSPVNSTPLSSPDGQERVRSLDSSAEEGLVGLNN